jgi:hypothetical protein
MHMMNPYMKALNACFRPYVNMYVVVSYALVRPYKLQRPTPPLQMTLERRAPRMVPYSSNHRARSPLRRFSHSLLIMKGDRIADSGPGGSLLSRFVLGASPFATPTVVTKLPQHPQP